MPSRAVKLRTKSFLLVAGSLLGVTLAMLGIVRFLAMRGFEQMEEWHLRAAIARVQKLLQHELNDLGRTVHDFAHSPAAADALVQPGTDETPRAVLAYDAGTAYGWTACMILSGEGRTLGAAKFDPGNKSSVQLPADFQTALQALPGLAEPLAELGVTQHMLVVDETVYLVAFSRIQNGTANATPPGIVIAAREIGPLEVQRIARIADVALQLHPVSYEARGPAPAGSARLQVERPERGKIGGRVTLLDAHGQARIALRAVVDAELHDQGVAFSRILMIVVIVGSLIICLLIDRVVVQPITERLGRLSLGLNKVQRSGNLSERLPTRGGRDEIATLAQEVNRLLTSVEITQRSMERVNAEMQQRVAERTAALAEANSALESDIRERIKAEQERERLREQLLHAHKMEAVGTLAGGIAHDFNNILTGILGHAQLMAADLPADSSVRRSASHVIAAAERAAALVRQILAFSRQAPGERRLVAVGQVAREALSLLRAALPANIEIRCETGTNADTVAADPTQLHQVFMNLGANAGHAIGSREGEIEVSIERQDFEETTLHLARALPPGEYLCISVRDTGCGMSPEVVERIFDPFFSTKPVNEGTGLGLAVVHGIVSEHGGAIDVESVVGKGTCFKIFLPAGGTLSETAAPEEAPSPAVGRERVLLVDDEELVLSVMTATLRRLGYVVTAELSSRAALRKFEASPDDFDVVITDQTMPQLSGLELSGAMKVLRPELPVILATGYSPDIAGRDATSLGLAGIVGKPIDFTGLTALMREALDRVKYPTGCKVA